MSTPIQFKELQIRNFLSYGNNTNVIDLRTTGTSLIIGENVDIGGQNGCGKTSIINALCYSLYNKAFDNISLQRLINSTNQLKNTLMEVRLFFSKGEDEYEIYRSRGESINIQIKENGVDITLDSITENDKLVEHIIGISYELFTKVVVFSGNSTPFLMMPVAQQRLQIEELFSITMLTEKAILLKELIKTTESDSKIKEAIIKEQENSQAKFKEQMSLAEARVIKWEEDKKLKLDKLKSDLQLLDGIDIDQEKYAHEVFDQLSKDKELISKSQTSLTTELKNLHNDVNRIIKEIEHLVTDKCPYCLQAFQSAGEKLPNLELTINQKDARIQEIESNLAQYKSQIDIISEQLAEVANLRKFSTLAEVIKAEASKATAQEKISELEGSENPHIDALVKLEEHAIEEISYTELDLLKREIAHQQFLLKLLTDKNSFIRKRIINRTIPFLNKRLISYTKELGLPHIVRFDDDMSCSVTEYGRELDFGNLSSGEKKRVNLSLSLAFRDVLHHLHAKLNCLFIDEIDASLDTIGVENVFKLLKQKTRDDGVAMWVISHRPEAVGRFDHTLTIKKQNGFSNIVTSE